MSAEIHQYTATVPANTPKTALFTYDIPLSNYTIESVDLEVPPGPAGLMGFYLARSGVSWIPYEADEYLVWDDRFDSWTLNDQPTGIGWQVVAYNIDTQFSHDVVVRFHVNPVVVSLSPSPGITIVTTPLPQVPVTL